jgi:hypothetical protein
MGDFLSSLFSGSNPTLGKDSGTLGSLAGFSSNLGQSATNTASQYYTNLLSGDPSKISQAIAPEIAANSEQAQQQKQTIGQFGGRSGGNTATANNIDTTSRGNITDLIGKLINGAAGSEASIGTTETGQAGTDAARQAQIAEEQQKNQQNSIFGGLLGGLGGVAGQAISGGLGMIPGLSAVI